MNQKLSKADRITRANDLARVFDQGRWAADGVLRLRVAANDLGRSRMAVAVGVRHGKAVARNRIKRLCREAFRTCRDQLPTGYDYVLQPRPGAELTLAATRQSLLALARSLLAGAKP